ncbi:hypothetical protein AB6A40_003586 [Gnathostoma spinigerum]|uniref:DM13 domain-containing protein n=1 Tax=Gnathostoma spinigerum TaxID=75299 RepID=A0ABD6EJL2_9BILA
MICALSTALVTSKPYYGVLLGEIDAPGVHGKVWIANETMLQLTHFTLSGQQLVFSGNGKFAEAPQLFLYVQSDGRSYLQPLPQQPLSFENQRIIVQVPGTLSEWKFFGVSNKKFAETGKLLSGVRLSQNLPQPYCCINGLPNGEHGTKSGKISIIDSQTFRIEKFSFYGTEAPDGWIVAGQLPVSGDGNQLIVHGHDTFDHHCPLKEDYYANTDLIAELPEGTNVYDTNYLSLYCVAYSVDFGHVEFNLSRANNPVPVHLPPVRTSPFPILQKIPCPNA